MFLTTMLSTKLAAMIGSAVIAAGTFSGVAYASNDAAPGDALYGLDCALEKVGLGDGGLQERLQEATKLCERGEVEKGLNHAAAAVQNHAGLDENGEAKGALTKAANAVQAANQGESTQIRARVAEMLQWMASTQAEGADFGQGVMERARLITGEAQQSQGENGQHRGEGNETAGEPQQGQGAGRP